MSYIDFYKADRKEKQIVFQQAAQQTGFPIYAIEKDWWVVQILRCVFQMPEAGYLLFKGGTSLSKAWKIIHRFSEDIDIALNREFLGFDSGQISKTQVRKLRKASYKYITETFMANLQQTCEELGFDPLSFELENADVNDKDPVSIIIYYPHVIDYPEYIQPRVKVEVGSRSLKEPFSHKSFTSIIGELYQNKTFADTAIKLPCINPERTYLEKLFLLHEEFQKPRNKIRVNRLSRHLYDIYQISKSPFKEKAYSSHLIREIIEHRSIFNKLRGIDYKNHYPPHLSPIPPDDYIAKWQADYRKMQAEMIPGESPSFEQIIDLVKAEANVYNQLKVSIDDK